MIGLLLTSMLTGTVTVPLVAPPNELIWTLPVYVWPAGKPAGLTVTVIVEGVVSWPVGETISQPCPPETVDELTLTLTGDPLLVREIVC